MRYNKNVETSNTRRPPVSSEIEEHTKVGGPKGLVNGREVEAHLGERFYCMMGYHTILLTTSSHTHHSLTQTHRQTDRQTHTHTHTD